jgi:hypothetical protein
MDTKVLTAHVPLSLAEKVDKLAAQRPCQPGSTKRKNVTA